MAEYFNSANGTISHPWTRDEINRMAELSREGYINQQIAEALGRSLAKVVYTFKKKTWTNIGRVWLKIEENSTLKKARK